ncbi:uncharacterized protein LOC120181605 [Hibiscus syriacus]|nr:uncharacterized protein LOC120181605 [Hibiscus syriacus]
MYSNDIGLDKSVEHPSKDRLLSVMPEGRDKVSQVSSSLDIFSDQNTVSFVKQKSPTSLATHAKRSAKDEASVKIDAVMRRTSSFNDAALSEASSFIEILKKPAHLHGTEAAAYGSAFEPSSYSASQAPRSGKKKGKKGWQIDPALLGFKVTSNRILMGEIQGID